MKKSILVILSCIFFLAVSVFAGSNYYVNDTYVAGTSRYCSANGNDGNDGKTPGAPKRTIMGLLGAHPNIGTNDMIFIDVGTYNEQVTVPSSIHGQNGKYVTFKGVASGGTNSVINGATIGGDYWGCIELTAVTYVKLDSLYVKYSGGQLHTRGIKTRDNCSNLIFVNNWVVSNGAEGIRLREDLGTTIAFSIVSNNHINNNDTSDLDWPAGLFINGGYRNRIVNNECKNNGVTSGHGSAIYLENNTGAVSNIIQKNIISGNNRYGIYMSIPMNFIKSNTLNNNSMEAIFFDSPNNYATGNQIFNNLLHGMNFNQPNSIANSNRIYNNSQRGIVIDGGGNTITLIGNDIHDNLYTGISIYRNSNILINNKVYKNQGIEGGIDINYGGYKDIIRGNEIYSNTSGHGIRIYNDSGVSFTNIISHNLIYGNNQYGIDFQAPYNLARSNDLYHNFAGGVRIDGNGHSDWITGNNIYNNSVHGVAAYNVSSSNLITYNKIYSNNQYGISLESPKNFALSNELYGNLASGLRVDGNGNHEWIAGNNVHNNSGNGIAVYRHRSIISNNIIHDNPAGNGIEMNYDASNNFTLNNVVYNNNNGLWFGNANNGNTMLGNVVSYNEFYGSTYNGIAGEGGDYITILSNKIHNNGTGLSFYNATNSFNLIKGNIIWKNTQQGVYLSGNHNYLINNTLNSNHTQGIQINGDGSVLRYNIISSNNAQGILMNDFNGAPCTNEYNIFYRNTGDGMTIDNAGANSLIKNCVFFKNGSSGFALNSGGSILIKNTIALSNNGFGYYQGGTSVTLNFCDAWGNGAGPTNNDTIPVNTSSFLKSDPRVLSTTFSDPAFLHLSGYSPCINAGDPTDSIPAGGGTRIDMGAYEYQVPPVPTFSSLSATQLSPGNLLTIGGNNFQKTQFLSTVKISNSIDGPVSIASYSFWSNTSIKVLVPATMTYNTTNTIIVSTWGGRIETNRSLVLKDLTPPYFSGLNPANGKTGVATNANILFNVSDNRIFASNNIKVSVAGYTALTNGLFQPGYTGTILPNGTGTNFQVTLAKLTSWFQGSNYTLTLNTRDAVGLPASLTTSFTITNLTGPVISALKPANGAVQVATNTNLSFIISEPSSVAAINSNSILVRISSGAITATCLSNGSFVAPFFTGPTSKVSNMGGKKSFMVRVDGTLPLPQSTLVSVFISGRDNSGIPVVGNSSFATVDLAPPTFTNISPTNNSVNVNPNTAIVFGVKDNTSVVSQSIWASVNGTTAVSNGGFKNIFTGAASKIIPDGTGKGFNVTIARTTLFPISSSVTTRIRTLDLYGNKGSNSVKFQVSADIVPPTSSVSPAGGSYFNSQQVTITAADNNGTNNLKVYYTTNQTTPTNTSASAEVTVTLTLQKDTVLMFRALDSAGNWGIVHTETYTFVKTPKSDAAVYPNFVDLSKGKDMKIVFAKPDSAEIRIYSMKGDLIKKIDKAAYAAGDVVPWDCKNDSGNKIGAGMYIVHVKGDKIDIKLNVLVVK